MKLNWGWGIATLYGCFVILIVTLVVGSSRQHFDLVSNDYYGEEIAFQKVIDGGKNQAGLSKPIDIHANTQAVTIDFPIEFKGKNMAGTILFYSPANAAWDYNYKIQATDLSINIDRAHLHKSKYSIKISCTIDGKNYYQESDISLL